MPYDYDQLYQETKNALGEPTDVFVKFFQDYPKQNARVLDIGCGQGRDALFIARLGHEVVGVDLSAAGIADLKSAAEAEKLSIEAVVADITKYQAEGEFDVILIDRTLHMINLNARLDVLKGLIAHLANGAWLLIADEPSNMKAFLEIIEAPEAALEIKLNKRGYLFARRLPE